jgi:hypothetical protein
MDVGNQICLKVMAFDKHIALIFVLSD